MSVLATAADSGGDGAYILWGFIFAAAAVGLLLLELLVPSAGLLGLLGGVAIIGSILAFFKHDTTFGFAALLAYAILLPILIVFGFKVWLHSPLGRRMVLGGGESSEEPADSEQTLRASEEERRRRLEVLRELVGAEGVTVTALRPVGVVKINGQRVDAMAENGVVDANTPVVVTDVYDNQIKVRPRT